MTEERFLSNGHNLVECPCDSCEALRAAEQLIIAEGRAAASRPIPVVDAWSTALAARRAAQATTFEDRYKAERTAEFAAEYARRDADPRRLTAAEAAERATELKSYAPPNGYDAGLAALRKEQQR